MWTVFFTGVMFNILLKKDIMDQILQGENKEIQTYFCFIVYLIFSNISVKRISKSKKQKHVYQSLACFMIFFSYPGAGHYIAAGMQEGSPYNQTTARLKTPRMDNTLEYCLTFFLHHIGDRPPPLIVNVEVLINLSWVYKINISKFFNLIIVLTFSIVWFW